MALTESQKRNAEKNRIYWANREEEALKHRITDEKEYDKQIKRIYQEMLDACQSEINAFYGKYAAKEGISIAEAKKRVKQADIAEYERKAKRYVRDKDFSAKANEEMRLYNATMKINRLEMLKANIGLELISGHDKLEKFMGGILKGRTEDELKRQAGILGKTVRNNAQNAHAIVNASFNNATFSDRIWQYQDLMRADLSKLLQQGLIQGKNARALTSDLRKYLVGDKHGKGATYNVERLMRTELARVQTEAQKQAFERNGFTEYEFITNSGCCDICQGLNGKHFKVAKMMPGENAPPIHPNCRCSVAAWEDSTEYEAWLEYLNQGGTTVEWNKMKDAEKAKFLPFIPIMRFNAASNIKEAKDFAIDMLGLQKAEAYSEDMNVEVANGVNEAIFKISNDFGILSEYGVLKKIEIVPETAGAYARYNPKTGVIELNATVNRKDAIAKLSAHAIVEYDGGAWSSKSPFHSVYHELGHATWQMVAAENYTLKNKIEDLFSAKYSDIMGAETEWKLQGDDIPDLAKKAKDAGFSYYGFRNSDEFVAEAIAQYYCSDEPSKITKEIIKTLLEG